MKRRYKSESIRGTKSGLQCYVAVDVGTVKRWTTIVIPWELVADGFEDIANGAEGVFLERLKRDDEQPTLPLEVWE